MIIKVYYSDASSSDPLVYENHDTEKPKHLRPRTPLDVNPSTPNTQFEYEMEAERFRQLADDMAIYSNHMVYFIIDDKINFYLDSNIEFGGFLWNDNKLVEVFESVKSSSLNMASVDEDTEEEIEEKEELNEKEREYYDNIYLPEFKNTSHQLQDMECVIWNMKERIRKMEEREDVLHDLTKRMTRLEDRDGTIFISLNSLTKKMNAITEIGVPEKVSRWVKERDQDMLNKRIQDQAHYEKIRLLKNLVKKKTTRIKELELLLESSEMALRYANVERREIQEILENKDKEIEEKWVEIIHLKGERERYEAGDINPYAARTFDCKDKPDYSPDPDRYSDNEDEYRFM